jgi:hypothetical protein
VTAALLLTALGVLAAAWAVAIRETGTSLRDASFAVVGGAGWGGLTFATGWWLAARGRQRVGAEVAVALAPMLKELKHVRRALAQVSPVDETEQTKIHPRRAMPVSDSAPTVVASYEVARGAVR